MLRQVNAAADVDGLTGEVAPAGSREQAHYAGIVVLAALTILAARNDIVRYWLR